MLITWAAYARTQTPRHPDTQTPRHPDTQCAIVVLLKLPEWLWGWCAVVGSVAGAGYWVLMRRLAVEEAGADVCDESVDVREKAVSEKALPEKA